MEEWVIFLEIMYLMEKELMMNIVYPITLSLQKRGELIITKAGNAH